MLRNRVVALDVIESAAGDVVVLPSTGAVLGFQTKGRVRAGEQWARARWNYGDRGRGANVLVWARSGLGARAVHARGRGLFAGLGIGARGSERRAR